METEQRDGQRPRPGGDGVRACGAADGRRGAALAPLALAGGVADRERGYSLYPESEPEPSRGEVAVLTGYVKTVDGEDVSRFGSTFRLPPGCHLVGTPRAWGQTGMIQGAVVVKSGELSFVLPTRAGFTHVVAVEVEPRSTIVGGARVVAQQRGPDGAVPREFAPLAVLDAAAGCRAEAPVRAGVSR